MNEKDTGVQDIFIFILTCCTTLLLKLFTLMNMKQCYSIFEKTKHFSSPSLSRIKQI